MASCLNELPKVKAWNENLRTASHEETQDKHKKAALDMRCLPGKVEKESEG